MQSGTLGESSPRDVVEPAAGSAPLSGTSLGQVGPWPAVAITTTALGVAIALGPVLGVVPVALASVLWTTAVVYLVVEALVRRAASWSGWHWLFIAGAGTALLRACSLGLVQFLRDRQSLFWNVDARNFAMLAQGIARFSGVRDTLDYAGARLEYHAGISWIAGSLNGTLGVPVNFGLFIVVPAVSVVVVGVGSYRLLKLLGGPTVASLVAVAVAVNLPSDPLDLASAILRGDRHVLLSPDTWMFSATDLMLIAFALAVGITASCILLASESWWGTLLGATCLATLAAIKPQYFIGFGAIVGIAYVQRFRRRPKPMPWSRLALVAAMVVVLAGLVAVVNPEQNTGFSSVTLDLLKGLRRTLFPVDVFFVEWYAFTGAVVSILVIASVPRLRNSLRDPPMSPSRQRDLVAYSLGAAAGALLLLFALNSTTQLVDGAQLARLSTVGWVRSRDWLDHNFNQALVPVGLIVVMLAVAQLTILLRRVRNPLRFAPALLVVLLMVGALPGTLSAMKSPTGSSAHEVSEEADLATLIGRVDTRKGVWLSSDMADSAENFYRPVLMLSVLALSDAQFYMGNLTYINWTRRGAVNRIKNMQRFFSTAWSPWHERFLRKHGVRYVIVRDRCPAAWSQTAFPGSVIGRAGDWTLLEVGSAPRNDSATRLWSVPGKRPAYGRSACLSGKVFS